MRPWTRRGPSTVLTATRRPFTAWAKMSAAAASAERITWAYTRRGDSGIAVPQASGDDVNRNAREQQVVVAGDLAVSGRQLRSRPSGQQPYARGCPATARSRSPPSRSTVRRHTSKTRPSRSRQVGRSPGKRSQQKIAVTSAGTPRIVRGGPPASRARLRRVARRWAASAHPCPRRPLPPQQT